MLSKCKISGVLNDSKVIEIIAMQKFIGMLQGLELLNIPFLIRNVLNISLICFSFFKKY